MRAFTHLFAIAILATVTGCASVGVRLATDPDRKGEPPILFPATAADVGVISYALARPFKQFTDPSFSPDAQEPIVLFVWLPVSVVDLPFALALDTICLPYDVHQRVTYVPDAPINPDEYLRDTDSE